MWEFKAENTKDALETVRRWVLGSIMPKSKYIVYRHPEREGYFIAEDVG